MACESQEKSEFVSGEPDSIAQVNEQMAFAPLPTPAQEFALVVVDLDSQALDSALQWRI